MKTLFTAALFGGIAWLLSATTVAAGHLSFEITGQTMDPVRASFVRDLHRVPTVSGAVAPGTEPTDPLPHIFRAALGIERSHQATASSLALND